MNQKDYTINQTFTLPSEGKVYSELVGPDITLRSMTTQEEMKRLSPSDMPYKNICEITFQVAICVLRTTDFYCICSV